MAHQLAGKIIAAYVRVSSDQQDTTRQRQSIEGWAKRNGVAIAQWFIDDKGKNPRDKADKRLDFQRLLRLIRADAIDAVVVDSQDRFGTKDAAQFWAFVSELRDHGCELWSVSQGHLSPDDDASVMVSTVGALTSTREQKEKAVRSLGGRIKTVKAGLYQGGYPPYGCDVVCYDPSGKEKWRLVWTGNFQRLKINADGTEQHFDGKDNLPGRDKTDTLRVQPSVRKDRLKVVRDIFGWFVSENISPAQIANRLRESKVDALFRGGWEKQRIAELLRNPAYIGLPSMNKRASGRHWEYVEGEMRAVKGKAKAGRVRKQEDWIGPDKLVYPPIVPVETFNKVQRKLSLGRLANRSKPRSPRVASFWLRNIVYCAGCNRPMRAWNENHGTNTYRSYFCANYGQYGINNPTGCRANRVKADLLEGLVERYLEETQEKIVRLLRRKPDDPLEHFTGELGEKAKELDTLRAQMRDFTKDSRFRRKGRLIKSAAKYVVTADDPLARRAIDLFTDLNLYRYVHKERLPEIKKRFAKLDAEHTGLVEKYITLPASGRAVEKIKARIAEIEPELKSLEASMENIADRFDQIGNELMARANAIQEIGKRVSTDAEYRRKGEAVKSIIGKAVCHFVPVEAKGKLRRSEFVRMDIVPQAGELLSILPDGSVLARD